MPYCTFCWHEPCLCFSWTKYAKPKLSNSIASARATDTISVSAQPHYTRLKPQPIEVIEAWGLNFHLANALKYIARAGQKPGASADSDLRKAIFYLRRLLGEQPLSR